MPIQHLVLSGGGPTAIKYLGTLKQLEMDGIWNSLNLKSIYGTSAGGILGVMLCCKHDWITLTDYIIKRPWENAFKISPDEVFNMYSKKGIVDIRFFEIFFIFLNFFCCEVFCLAQLNFLILQQSNFPV